MNFTLPIRTKSGDNAHEHWRAKAARAKAQRGGACVALRAAAPVGVLRESLFSGLNSPGLTVTLTRVAPRPLDTDGNASGMKSIRDGIADALGLKSDADPRVSWVYGQRRGGVGEYAVEVAISERTHCPTCGGVR